MALNYLKDNVFFIKYGEDDCVKCFPGSKKGNSVYASRQTEVIKNAVSQFNFDNKSCLWVTCTQEINYSSLNSVEKSYRKIKNQIPKFIRKLKKIGLVKYLYVIEAHKKGGAHVHLLIELNRLLPYHKDEKNSKVLRLSDKKIRNAIKFAWGKGHVDVQVVSSNGVAGYIVKELTKNSSIERSLKRLKEGKPLKNDLNRVWGFYFMVLRIKGFRSWGTSRNIKRLDLDMNNSTVNQEPVGKEAPSKEDLDDKTSLVLLLNREITKQEWFEPICGVVERGSRMEFELRKLLDEAFVRKKDLQAIVAEALSNRIT